MGNLTQIPCKSPLEWGLHYSLRILFISSAEISGSSFIASASPWSRRASSILLNTSKSMTALFMEPSSSVMYDLAISMMIRSRSVLALGQVVGSFRRTSSCSDDGEAERSRHCHKRLVRPRFRVFSIFHLDTYRWSFRQPKKSICRFLLRFSPTLLLFLLQRGRWEIRFSSNLFETWVHFVTHFHWTAKIHQVYLVYLKWSKRSKLQNTRALGSGQSG